MSDERWAMCRQRTHRSTSDLGPSVAQPKTTLTFKTIILSADVRMSFLLFIFLLLLLVRLLFFVFHIKVTFFVLGIPAEERKKWASWRQVPKLNKFGHTVHWKYFWVLTLSKYRYVIIIMRHNENRIERERERETWLNFFLWRFSKIVWFKSTEVILWRNSHLITNLEEKG